MSIKVFIDRLSRLGFDMNGGKTKVNAGSDIADLCIILLNLNGEAASIAIAEQIFALYESLDETARLDFFRFMLEQLNADADKVTLAIENYQTEPKSETMLNLSLSCRSRRIDLYRALNMAKQGTAKLIKIREDILKLVHQHPELKSLDTELQEIFVSWFNRGFLELRCIDWSTRAEVLEKLIEYEAVHAIQGWDDLRRRLADDRRCFAFFHPVLPNTPVIFMEVALRKGISTNIATLLNQKPPSIEEDDHDTAVFYSISNCFKGLKGVSFGNLLIKQVVERLAHDLPDINTYCTISPVPGFMKWLRKSADELEFLEDTEQSVIASFLEDEKSAEKPAELLIKLCAYFLCNIKSRAKPADPVARFHLGNGACLQQINWAADTSGNGLSQSAGIMVNYLYDRKTLTRNHEAYVQKDTVVCSKAVSKLLT